MDARRHTSDCDSNGGRGYWREGALLVASDRVILPSRCVKCNSDQQVTRKVQTFYWFPRWALLLLFVNLLVFAIAATLLQRRITVAYYICKEHERKKRIEATVAILAAVVGFATIIVGAFSFKSAVMGIAGAVMFLGALLYVFVYLPTLRIVDCRDGKARFRAVDKRYLDSLDAEIPVATPL